MSVSTNKVFGEFVAEMLVTVDKDAYEKKESGSTTVEDAVRDAFGSGRVGNLKVEPESLVMKAPGKTKI